MKKTILVGMLFVTISTTVPAEVSVSKVGDGIVKIAVNDFVNLVALVGPDGVFLVDSGFADEAGGVEGALNELGDSRVRYLVNTHPDYDHVDGNRVLGRDATILAHTDTRKRMRELIESQHELYKDFPEASLPNATFDESVTVFFDSEEIRLIPLVGGHTDGDVVVFFESSNVAYLGDIVLFGSFPVVKLDMGGDVHQLAENVRALVQLLPADVVLVAGHGRDGTKDDLKDYERMLRETVGAVSETVDLGGSCDELNGATILKDWSSWSGTVFDEVDAQMWAETICRNLLKETAR
jgi:glyoxylase-like metal-dependent hydrolase (beta-lactamase superfamily II)